MDSAGEGRKHDLLWAAIIFAGFGVLFGLIILGTRDNGLTRKGGSELVTQADRAVARGDKAVSDEYLDFGRAREEYRAAYDLLRSAGDEHQKYMAEIQLRIVRSYVKERNFPKALDEVKLLQKRYPSFQPEALALLRSHIESELD